MEQNSSSLFATAASGKPTDRERVIGELTRGREIADQLQAILCESRGADATSVLPARGLVEKILNSFTLSLSVLNAVCDSEDQVPPLVPAPHLSEDSGESCKTVAAPKDRRGCYKRRRASEIRTIDSSTLCDDGHAWRKYGQKAILNTKHPRNYFRCTHKFDQGCQATKYVQKVAEDPPLYRTTYHDHHTCNNLLFKYSSCSQEQIIVEVPDLDPSSRGASTILSFQSCLGVHKPNATSANNNNNNAHVHHLHVKKENRQEPLLYTHDQFPMNPSSPSPTATPPHDTNSNNNKDDYYFVSPAPPGDHDGLISASVANFQYINHEHGTSMATNAAFSSGSDIQEDVYSSTSASNHMSGHEDDDMDHLMVASVFVHDDDDDLLPF